MLGGQSDRRKTLVSKISIRQQYSPKSRSLNSIQETTNPFRILVKSFSSTTHHRFVLAFNWWLTLFSQEFQSDFRKQLKDNSVTPLLKRVQQTVLQRYSSITSLIPVELPISTGSIKHLLKFVVENVPRPTSRRRKSRVELGPLSRRCTR